MNSPVIALSVLAVIITTFTAIRTKKSWLRLCAASFLFLLLVGATKFSVEAAARRVVTVSVQNGTYTKEFGDGVRSFVVALSPMRGGIVICGVGLLLISLTPKKKKKKSKGAD